MHAEHASSYIHHAFQKEKEKEKEKQMGIIILKNFKVKPDKKSFGEKSGQVKRQNRWLAASHLRGVRTSKNQSACTT